MLTLSVRDFLNRRYILETSCTYSVLQDYVDETLKSIQGKGPRDNNDIMATRHMPWSC